MCPSLHVRVFMNVLAWGILTLLGRVLLGVLVPNYLFWDCKTEESSESVAGLNEAWKHKKSSYVSL